jgi:DNA-binding NarL/FixJ family response regulator
MKTILIIEDQSLMRRKLETILKMEGFEVLVAENGTAGIRLAQAELPDLVLCDIMMPECDGYAVLQALRIHKTTASTPFIFLTAKGDKRDFRAGMSLGADDYLVKPVPRTDLLEAIEARFERVRLNEERVRDKFATMTFRPNFESPLALQEKLALTPREAETLLWVAQGKSNAEIAIILGIAEKTVKKTMGHIFEKLGLESRTAAAVRAVEVLTAPAAQASSGPESPAEAKAADKER